MSEVIAFCERHGISSLQHLLDHCGPTTHMRELLAVKVLEDLSVNDPEKLGELSKIRSKLDPVEMMAKIRATAKKQEEKILEATKIKQGEPSSHDPHFRGQTDGSGAAADEGGPGSHAGTA